MAVPRPFSIHVSNEILADLRERLTRTRWPEGMPGDGWDFGASLGYIQELCEYWRDGFDWRAQEARLNEYPQFLGEVDGLDFHYYHVRGNGPEPFPLLLVHGWPGSIFEFHHLIGPLTDPAAHGGDPADAFDVVIPALPGYGFGGKPKERGWGPTRTAAAFNTLMTDVLGYERYGTQGGDWGGIITARMAANHPGRLAGSHLNMVIAPLPKEPTAEDIPIIEHRRQFQALETGYSSTQGTKPMSLAIAQSDSPAGIAAWIVEKFRTWSDCNGDVESVYTKDQLLTNIMFYWAPNSIDSAARMYWESRRESPPPRDRVQTPIGVTQFAKEIYLSRREWLEKMYDVRRFTEFESGGHFAALEKPHELLTEIRAFFREIR